MEEVRANRRLLVTSGNLTAQTHSSSTFRFQVQVAVSTSSCVYSAALSKYALDSEYNFEPAGGLGLRPGYWNQGAAVPGKTPRRSALQPAASRRRRQYQGRAPPHWWRRGQEHWLANSGVPRWLQGGWRRWSLLQWAPWENAHWFRRASWTT